MLTYISVQNTAQT